MEWGTAAAVAEAVQPNSESACHEQSVCDRERAGVTFFRETKRTKTKGIQNQVCRVFATVKGTTLHVDYLFLTKCPTDH